MKSMSKVLADAIALAAVAAFTVAAAPTPATSIAETPTAAATAAASTVTPALSPTEELPPRPGSPTPTPRLPEEGGPPGGVLGGHIYVDSDGSRSLTSGDGVWGGTVIVDELNAEGNYVHGRGIAADVNGAWQVRALPDGVYRVYVDPEIPESQWPLTIPPVQTINLTPGDTEGVYNNIVNVITTTVEIRGANRILDIDFGVPPQQPITDRLGTLLPQTGTGSAGASRASFAMVVAGFSVALFGAAWLSLRGRRRARGR